MNSLTYLDRHWWEEASWPVLTVENWVQLSQAVLAGLEFSFDRCTVRIRRPPKSKGKVKIRVNLVILIGLITQNDMSLSSNLIKQNPAKCLDSLNSLQMADFKYEQYFIVICAQWSCAIFKNVVSNCLFSCRQVRGFLETKVSFAWLNHRTQILLPSIEYHSAHMACVICKSLISVANDPLRNCLHE